MLILSCRYRARRKEREAASEQAVEELSKRLEELQAHNHALESRERLITQLVQAQELHLDKLGRHQVRVATKLVQQTGQRQRYCGKGHRILFLQPDGRSASNSKFVFF